MIVSGEQSKIPKAFVHFGDRYLNRSINARHFEQI